MVQSYLQADHHPKGSQARENTPLLSSSAAASASAPAYQGPYCNAHQQPAPPVQYSSPPAYSSVSTVHPTVVPQQIHHHYHFNDRRRAKSRTCCKSLFSTLFLVLFVFIILLVPLIWSYASRLSVLDHDLERVVKAHTVYSGPESVQVINVTNWGVWVNAEGKIGVDAASVIGVQREGRYGDDDGPEWKMIWKAVGRWGITNMKTVNIRLEGIEVWGVYSDDGSQSQGKFFNVVLPPMDVPISADRSSFNSDDDWVTPFSTPIFLQPAIGRRVSDMFNDDGKFVNIQVRAKVAKVRPWGSTPGTGPFSTAWWGFVDCVSELLEKRLTDVKVGTSIKLPSIPGFPRIDKN